VTVRATGRAAALVLLALCCRAPAATAVRPARPMAQAPSPRGAAAARTTPADSTGPDTARVRVPVMIHGDTVLFLETRHGAFTPQERADAVVRRVLSLSRATVDSVRLAPADGATDLVVGDLVLLTVSDADAAAAGRPRDALAAQWAAALSGELQRASLTATLKIIGFGALWTALATGVLAFLLVLLGRVFPRLYARIESWRRTRMPAVRFQRLELLSADRLTDFLLGAARLIRIVIVVLLLYFYIPLVLSFFPWTQRLSDSLFGYVTTPLLQVGQAFLNYLPNVFFIAVIVLVTRYVLKLIHLFFAAIERGTVTLPNFDREWAEPTYKIVRFLVLAFAVIVVFPYLPGAKSDAFKGVSIFLGVLFSLGSSSAIANIVAGTVLTYTRAFSVGDRVQIGETTGDVIARTLLVTRVRTIKNVDITVPNAMVLSSHIHNYSAMAQSEGLILHTTVTIGYDAPWKQVHELLIAAARATEGILPKPEPFVLQTALDDFFVRYELNAYSDQPAAMARTYSQLHANIQDTFNAAGVEIMSPHYAALRDGNDVAIPEAQRPQRGQPPAFRVRRTGEPPA